MAKTILNAARSGIVAEQGAGEDVSHEWQDEFGMKAPGLFHALPASAGRGQKAASVFGKGRAASSPPQVIDDDLEMLSLLRVRHDPERLWADLPALEVDQDHLAAQHLLTTHQEDPVGLLYDHLRTRLLQALTARDWRRVAVTAPTRGCGASLVASNLALSLARRPSGRNILIDMDFRKPSLAGLFGVAEAAPLRDLLVGQQPMEAVLQRMGKTLALGLNGRPEVDAAELLQEPATAQALRQLVEDLAPDVILYDMPPLLESDDVLAFLPQVDGVLLVVDGARNTAQQVRDCERLLEGETALLGVIMNRAEDSPVRRKLRR